MNKSKNKRGITLIALVITIIVMLILVAVTISMAVNGGLFNYAGKAAGETQNAINKEQQLAGGQVTIEGMNFNSIDDFLQSTEGIVDKSITVTSSNQEIKFTNTITKGHVWNEKKDYKTYEIKGISLEKDGEYITTGKLTGKSGDLEIVGDIKDTTFIYNLTSFMLGDEVFYCKLDIDGEEFYQQLKVVQGECVFYDESYMNWMIYTKNDEGTYDSSECEIVEGETWNGRKSIRVHATSGQYSKTKFDFIGNGATIIWGQTEKNYGNLVSVLYDSEGNIIENDVKLLDSETLGLYEYEIPFVENDVQPNSLEFTVSYIPFQDPWSLGKYTVIIDGIKIWR